MSSELWLLISMAVSLGTGLALWHWFSPALRILLEQICQRPGSTEFWLRYTQLMLLMAPLVIAITFSPEADQYTVTSLRRILLAVLIGHFTGFALVGRSLFKAVKEAMKREPDAVDANPAKA